MVPSTHKQVAGCHCRCYLTLIALAFLIWLQVPVEREGGVTHGGQVIISVQLVFNLAAFPPPHLLGIQVASRQCAMQPFQGDALDDMQGVNDVAQRL